MRGLRVNNETEAHKAPDASALVRLNRPDAALNRTLRDAYEDVVQEPVPDQFRQLIEQFRQTKPDCRS